MPTFEDFFFAIRALNAVQRKKKKCSANFNVKFMWKLCKTGKCVRWLRIWLEKRRTITLLSSFSSISLLAMCQCSPVLSSHLQNNYLFQTRTIWWCYMWCATNVHCIDHKFALPWFFVDNSISFKFFSSKSIVLFACQYSWKYILHYFGIHYRAMKTTATNEPK